MVQNTDTHMGTHTHIWAKQEFWPIRVYGLPVRIWTAHTRTGISHTHMGCQYAYAWAAHMHTGQPIRVWAEYLHVWDGTHAYINC